MRSNNVGRHMKIHVKYNQPEKYGVKIRTNEEMCRELVMDLVDNVIDNTITCRNEDLSEKPHGLKRTYEELKEDTSIIDIEALREAVHKKTQEYREK
jgi:hypothetical protein